ncbi:MAG: hypothetical protein EXR09_04850 [Acetobacteraceae bacterium]|nr:hypothetical protein [Acetobacteraceae bacterium]
MGPLLVRAPALALRFVADDLKALYGEAAQAEGGPPSARQIDHWFWRQPFAGAMLIPCARPRRKARTLR